MKGIFLFVGHGQSQEWMNAARFFSLFGQKSLLRSFDILAYVNSTGVSAGAIEEYLTHFPNKIKRLFYTPCNGHSLDSTLSLDCAPNVYKIDTSVNRMGYWYGIIEAYANTFDLLRQYDYVIQLNPDVYITDSTKIECYLESNYTNSIAHHVNTMRGDIENGFSTDFHIYRPNLFHRNHFSDYALPDMAAALRMRSEKEKNYRFIPEQLLKKLVIGSGLCYTVIGPSTRNNREIDQHGLWHCHNNRDVDQFLANA